MLKNDIIKKNLESVDLNEVKYLFYLSTKNAWVNVADDLFKIKITNIIETLEHQVGSTVYFNKKFHPVTEKEELTLKLLISKLATHVSVFGVNSDVYQIDATENKYLLDLTLKSIQKSLFNIYFNLGNQSISLSIELCNFDNEFIKQINTLTSINEKTQIIHQYKSLLNEAKQNGTANAFWKAAQSGDDEQLQLLFDEFNDFDINRNYEGKSIIEAIFEANSQIDVPFKNVLPNYKSTIEILLTHGLDRQLIDAASKKYHTVQNSLWFFQQANPMHKKMLALLNHIDTNEKDNELDFESINCAIQ